MCFASRRTRFTPRSDHHVVGRPCDIIALFFASLKADYVSIQTDLASSNRFSLVSFMFSRDIRNVGAYPRVNVFCGPGSECRFISIGVRCVLQGEWRAFDFFFRSIPPQEYVDRAYSSSLYTWFSRFRSRSGLASCSLCCLSR